MPHPTTTTTSRSVFDFIKSGGTLLILPRVFNEEEQEEKEEERARDLLSLTSHNRLGLRLVR